jgi:hypothetical protein
LERGWKQGDDEFNTCIFLMIWRVNTINSLMEQFWKKVLKIDLKSGNPNRDSHVQGENDITIRVILLTRTSNSVHLSRLFLWRLTTSKILKNVCNTLSELKFKRRILSDIPKTKNSNQNKHFPMCFGLTLMIRLMDFTKEGNRRVRHSRSSSK